MSKTISAKLVLEAHCQIKEKIDDVFSSNFLVANKEKDIEKMLEFYLLKYRQVSGLTAYRKKNIISIYKDDILQADLTIEKPFSMTRKEAICQFTGIESEGINQYRYHAGRTSIPVYAFADGYYCVTRQGEKPAKHRDGMEFRWQEKKDDYLNRNGFKVWEHIY